MVGFIVSIIAFFCEILVLYLSSQRSKNHTFRNWLKLEPRNILLAILIIAVSVSSGLITNFIQDSDFWKTKENSLIENTIVESSTNSPANPDENQVADSKTSVNTSTTKQDTTKPQHSTSNTTDIELQRALKKISDYENKKDYSDGINYINNLSSNIKEDRKIQNKLNFFINHYRNDILDSAEETFTFYGYEKALDILKEASKTLPEDTILQERIKKYESYAPIPISRLFYTGDSYNFCDTAFDPHKNSYSNALHLYNHLTNLIGYVGEIELYTKRQYSTFTCNIVPEKDFSTDKKAGSIIKIYKDDNLEFVSNIITYKTNPIPVELDIRNTEYLKITIENVGPNYPVPYVDTLICDAFVQK